MGRLDDRVIVVTGGTRGLGLACAQRLLRDGARVVVSARSAPAAPLVSDREGASRLHWVQVDNSDPLAGQTLREAALERWGRVDGAVLSVGDPARGDWDEVDDQAWTRDFENLILGTRSIVRELSAAMDEGGSVVVVLSVAVQSLMPELAVSNSLRPGLAMLTRAMSQTLGSRGIRVNGLLTGWIATGRLREIDAMTPGDSAVENNLANIPLARYGRPDEFAATAAFLISDESSYISGAMIPVDGGFLAAR